MDAQRQIYIMISRTDTFIGHVIRTFCRYPYNHVSLTPDPGMRYWYSFARYSQDAPFYAGFIREPVERLLAGSGSLRVRIFRLEIPEQQLQKLEQLLQQKGLSQERLIYNHFDAVASGIGLRVQVPDAYTCLSFTCSILGKSYRTIKALNNALQPYLIYEGDLAQLVPDSGSREDPYFAPLGLLRGTAASARQLGILSLRLASHSFSGYMAHRFHRTIH